MCIEKKLGKSHFFINSHESHPSSSITKKQTPSRSLTLSDILKIHKGYGPVLPIGTPICTSCLVKLSAPSIEEDIEDVMTRDITTKTQRQHVIHEEPLHDDFSSATAEMDVAVSNQETIRKLKADPNSSIETDPDGQNKFMQFQADMKCTDSESEFFQSRNMLARVAEILFANEKRQW